MGNINTGKVILAGLVAGLVINAGEFVLNAVILASDWEAVMTRLGLPAAFGPTQILAFNVLGFIVGIFTVWLYAAIRPRYGAGPGTAIKAGVATWFIGSFMASMYPVITGMFPKRLVVIACAWGLAEFVLAALVGGKLYKEEGGAVGTSRAAAS
jgi:hypothetical protein